MKSWARHLGGAYTFNGANQVELKRRLRAMQVGWLSLWRYWSSHTRRSHKRAVFMGRVLQAGLSGLESYAFLQREIQQLDTKIYKYLSSLEKGKATEKTGEHMKRSTYQQLFNRWQLLPVAGELAIRRTKWLQQIVANPKDARQVRAAIWGHLPGEQPTINDKGQIAEQANPFAQQFFTDLWLYFDLSPFDEFFRDLGGF